MQENFEIVAVSRSEQGKGASRRLRREGMVPGIIYGGGKAPEMFATTHNELIQHLDHEAFYSHILTVKLDDKVQKVVLKDLQRHPAKPFVTHLDLMRVAAGDRIKMQVPLHFVNEDTCVGVKMGGQVSHHMTDVEVVCAAEDLPEYIEVDVADVEVGQIVHLQDMKLPKGVELVALTHGEVGEHEFPVVSVQSRGSGEVEEEEGGEDTEV
jgi:large subunit ribosomal protein L25